MCLLFSLSFQLVFQRADVEKLLPITNESTAKTISGMAAAKGLAFSARTAARIARDVRDDANLGAPDKQFQLFASYAKAIQDADPTATTQLQTNRDHEFVSFFVSWGYAPAAIALVKPVVAIDGAHLSPDGTGTVRKFWGIVLLFFSFLQSTRLYAQLLLMVASDGNNELVPLAAAIAKTETTEVWSAFLQCCVGCMPVLNTPEMIIMSDRSAAIESAVSSTCERAQHVICTVHLVRNVIAHIRSAADAGLLKALIYRAAEAPLKPEFERALGEIQALSDAAYGYLRAIDPAKWAQSHSHNGCPRFYIVTSNAVESLNAVLVEARQQGPVKVLAALYEWTFRQFGARRALSMESAQQFTDRATSTLQEAATAGRLCDRVVLNGVQAQVFDKGKAFAVHLDDVTCSCGHLAMLGLPCGHIFRAFATIGKAEEPYKHVARYWMMDRQRELYAIQLAAIPTHCLQADEQLSAPAFTKTGKRRKKRILSSGESLVPAQRQRHEKTLAGEPVGAATAREERAVAIAAAPGGVTMLGNGQALVHRPGGQQPHVVDLLRHTCEKCGGFLTNGTCSHLQAAAIAMHQQTSTAPRADPANELMPELVDTARLRNLLPPSFFP